MKSTLFQSGAKFLVVLYLYFRVEVFKSSSSINVFFFVHIQNNLDQLWRTSVNIHLSNSKLLKEKEHEKQRLGCKSVDEKNKGLF